jgi:arginase
MALNTALESDNRACQKNELDSTSLEIWNQIKALKCKTNTSDSDQTSLEDSKNLNEYSIPPQNIVFIGIRSFEEEEIQLVRELGIKVFFAEDVHKLGIDNTIQQALSYLETKTENWYVSFDVDSLDPTLSQGTGTPVENGLQLEQATPLIRTLWNHPKTQCFEVTEINRELDPNNDMVEVICALLKESIQ